MEKSQGLTPSEQYLAKLCEKTFLSLWSYPNLFNDKGQHSGKGVGQELCDLLVVFGNDIVIFSDKSCSFPDGDVNLAWKRWYKKAVAKSADQVYGAERWIREFPNRIYLDRHCTKKLELPLPSPEQIRVHRVVVALNAGKPLKKYFGGNSGSLVLIPSLIGDDATNDQLPEYQPFQVGQINPAKGFIHIFDDESLDIILGELNTASDFIQYLRKKEEFILSGKLGSATGEEDLLAFYIKNIEEKDSKDFNIPKLPDGSIIGIGQGLWEDLKRSPQYKAKNRANKASRLWDNLIEEFHQNYKHQTLILGNNTKFNQHELVLRTMASESRFNRRYLSERFLQFYGQVPNSRQRGARYILSLDNPNMAYLLVLLSRDVCKNYDEYRQTRRDLLQANAVAVKANQPNLKLIVGIATETISPNSASYDLLYMDVNGWTEEDIEKAQDKQREANLLLPENLTSISERVHEYPDIAIPKPLDGFWLPNNTLGKEKAKSKRKTAKQSRKTNRKK